jgi:hypothetical protein
MKQIKRFLQIRLVMASIIFVMVVALGSSIIQEGWHLMFAPTIETFAELNDIENDNRKYSYLKPEMLTYTEIDIILEQSLSTKRYNGYVAAFDNQYFLVFRQDNIDNQSTMILMPSFFSDDNNLLFKTNVFDQIMVTEGLTLQEINSVFHPHVLIDVRGRIKSDIPVVVLWFLIVGLFGALMGFSLKEYYDFTTKKNKYKYLRNGKLLFKSNKLLLNQKALYIIKRRIHVFPVDSIREYSVNQDSLTLYFKNVKLQINAPHITIQNFKRVLFPEILNYEN